ncbi:thioesterase [Aspergillus sclerotialis]|uniref:Thioesterase n=1 Tax=Aspergillus sclerotialis TaxID=2070753 RepID=A0A3A3A1J9_9EURO|nr:thioesterase [Aspergillus sclerotialis]
MAATKESMKVAVEEEFQRNLAHYFTLYCNFTQEKCWDPDFRLCQLRIESATVGPPPKVTFRFTTVPEMCNNNGDIHGGCATTYIDALTTVLLATMSQPGFYSQFGVSRNLSITFFKPIHRGTDVRLVCTVVNAGKRLAALRAELYRVDTGELCVMGKNDKVNTDPKVPVQKL